ncbi:hypothetical protein D3C72_2253530 [compost metagenome]
MHEAADAADVALFNHAQDGGPVGGGGQVHEEHRDRHGRDGGHDGFHHARDGDRDGGDGQADHQHDFA